MKLKRVYETKKNRTINLGKPNAFGNFEVEFVPKGVFVIDRVKTKAFERI